MSHSNKSNMGDAVLRLMTLLRHLPRAGKGPKRTSRQIKDYLSDQGFEVSKRTVERDLAALSGPPFYIQRDNAKPEGWCWARDAKPIEIPEMEPTVALTFKLAETFLSRMLPPPVLKHLKSYFDSANGILVGLDTQSLGDWPKRIRILPRGQALLAPKMRDDVVEIVYQALLEGKRFRCRYRSREAEQERGYEVSPLAIVARDNVLYLVCCLWSYGDVMQLALHRMISAELLDAEASVPDGFDLDAYIGRGAFDFASGEMLKLEARFSRNAAYHLRETPVEADQTITDQGDELLLAATVPDTLQLRWWLLGFGADVEVLAPAGLREEMTQTARAMSARYRDQGVTIT